MQMLMLLLLFDPLLLLLLLLLVLRVNRSGVEQLTRILAALSIDLKLLSPIAAAISVY